MRLLRGLVGALLWILAALVGLVAVLLCVTVILLPLGIPLLMLSRRLFGQAVRLVLPRSVTHPAQELGKSARKAGRSAASRAPSPQLDAKAAKKKTRKFLRRQRKRLT